MADNRTGQHMIRAGLISEDQLEFALAEQARGSDRLGVVMRRLNLVTEDAMARVLWYKVKKYEIKVSEDDPADSTDF